jgi:hypothetical protein
MKHQYQNDMAKAFADNHLQKTPFGPTHTEAIMKTIVDPIKKGESPGGTAAQVGGFEIRISYTTMEWIVLVNTPEREYFISV